MLGTDVLFIFQLTLLMGCSLLVSFLNLFFFVYFLRFDIFLPWKVPVCVLKRILPAFSGVRYPPCHREMAIGKTNLYQPRTLQPKKLLASVNRLPVMASRRATLACHQMLC